NFIWYPYNSKGLLFSTEEELSIEANYFYRNHLLPNKDSLSKRVGITYWWELTRPRNWQFENNKKLISTEFGNSSSFAFDVKGIYVVERGYAWQPRKKMGEDDYYF